MSKKKQSNPSLRGNKALEKRIERLLSSAYENVPFYNNLFNDIAGEEDELNYDFFSKLPIYDKETIRNTGWVNFVSGEYLDDNYDIKKSPKLRIETTSGTTGVPMKVLWNKNDFLLSTVNLWNHRLKFGVSPASRYCTSLKHVPNGKTYLIDGNKLTFTSMLFSNETVSEIIEAINDFQPEWLFMQNSVLFTLLYWGEKLGMCFPDSVKYIEYMGEPLNPYYRKYIETRTKAQSANMYGCTEAGIISYECSHLRNHLLPENVFVQIVNETGKEVEDGEDGFVCVTGLHNTAMPVLRYRLNDIACIDRKHNCPCCNSNPIISIKSARMPEFLILDDWDYCDKWALYAPANKENQLIDEHPDDIAFNFKIDSLDHYNLYVYKNPNNIEDIGKVIEELFINYGLPFVRFTVHESKEYDSSMMAGILRMRNKE